MEQERGGARTDRRKFLGTIGKTIGAALGLTVLTAGPAFAANTICCRNSNCPWCPGDEVRFRCQNGCNGNSWCTCHLPVGQECYTQPCV